MEMENFILLTDKNGNAYHRQEIFLACGCNSMLADAVSISLPKYSIELKDIVRAVAKNIGLIDIGGVLFAYPEQLAESCIDLYDVVIEDGQKSVHLLSSWSDLPEDGDNFSIVEPTWCYVPIGRGTVSTKGDPHRMIEAVYDEMASCKQYDERVELRYMRDVLEEDISYRKFLPYRMIAEHTPPGEYWEFDPRPIFRGCSYGKWAVDDKSGMYFDWHETMGNLLHVPMEFDVKSDSIRFIDREPEGMIDLTPDLWKERK